MLSAGVLVILPGGPGTRSEARLAVRCGKPAISCGAAYPGLPEAKDLAAAQEHLRKLGRKMTRIPANCWIPRGFRGARHSVTQGRAATTR